MTAPRSLPAARVTEKEFSASVVDLARTLGWTVAHFHPLLGRDGRWLTPVQADGRGFPDLLMLRGNRQLVCELKVGRNKATPEQEAWLAAFNLADVPAYCWKPTDWDEIETTLKELR